MNNPYATQAPTLDPNTGFATSPSPSVAQAAQDLRAAAGEKMSDFSSQAHAIKEKAIESASHFRDITADKARAAAIDRAQALKTVATEKAQHLKEIAGEQWNETREKAREVHVAAEDYIRQYPTKCVLGALGVGFLIGLIVRR